MIYRFNYTQRQPIEPRRVSIELHETGADAPPTFSMTLDLAGLRLPGDARLVVAVSDGRAAMRFDWGTVAAPAPPSDRRLTEVRVNPAFRIMAQDSEQKILALANSIKPKRAAGRESLLWLQEADLEQEVWRLDFVQPGRPTLLVNRSIAGISAAIRQEDALRGPVLPEALRGILTRALIVDDAAPDDEDGDWGQWLAFVGDFHAADYPGIDADGQRDKNAVSAWIEDAVAAFTQQRFHARNLYAAARA